MTPDTANQLDLCRLSARARPFAAVLLLSMCGCYTGPSPQNVTQKREGLVGPHEWVCALSFGQIRKETVTAEVTPAFLYLEIRTGDCGVEGTLRGTSATGALAVELGTGGYHVRIGNPGDTAVEYAIGVTHLMPGL